MRKISLILLVLLMTGLLVSSVYGETIRQGDVRVSFNQNNAVTKTSDYTVVAGDSLINVTAASANITITLPTVASTRPGVKSYKILKTDKTAYAVIVTPATGDTIGGEATRYLFGANDYIVISTGSGKNWAVAFESPYVNENYASGLIKTNAPDSNTLYCGSGAACGNTPSAIKTVYGYIALNAAGVATISSIGLTDAASKTALFNSTSSFICVGNIRQSAGVMGTIAIAFASQSTIIITSTPSQASIVEYFCSGY
ncbi:MAG: hypothetical protein WC208_15870 [Gallionella sp.]|jgi:hypothetical protein